MNNNNQQSNVGEHKIDWLDVFCAVIIILAPFVIMGFKEFEN